MSDQSVICRCARTHDTRWFCSDCGGAILPSDLARKPRTGETGPSTRVVTSRASEATRGENTDWLSCPHCHMSGYISVRKCKTHCGNCKQIISTCADL